MWLLKTTTAELVYFISPEEVPGGYAILSHVWREHEQSFQDVKAIIERCKQSGLNPRDEVSEKIRRCCEIAEGEGLQWVWNDTCCIDKTSSAELSEAINSMFRYYALSTVCFVYLDDVKELLDVDRPPELQYTRWVARGWTLQELIAPALVIMLSRSWTSIGSKHSLAQHLEDVTGVPACLLRHETHLSDYSVAQRMSWAADRRTTRIEDEAYCLLGIFDISMPTLYGEGRHAFQRLQEEIMKTRLDTTLYAWSPEYPVLEPVDWEAVEDGDLERFPLLARSPYDFICCNKVVTLPDSKGPEAAMSFQISPHGIRARVPLFVFEEKTYINLSCTHKIDSHDVDYPDVIAPILLRVKQFTTGGPYFVIGHPYGPRIYLDTSEEPLPCGEMTDIYLANDTSDPGSSTSPHPLCNHIPDAPFRFYMTVNTKTANVSAGEHAVSIQNVEESWKRSPSAVISISAKSHRAQKHGLVICGICNAQKPPIRRLFEPSSSVHWARVTWHRKEQNLYTIPDEHDCTKDHILDWADLKRVFWDHNYTSLEEGLAISELWTVELAFCKSNLYPNTLILRAVTWDYTSKFTYSQPAVIIADYIVRFKYLPEPDSSDNPRSSWLLELALKIVTRDRESRPSRLATSHHPDPVCLPNTESQNDFTSYLAFRPHEAVRSTYSSFLREDIFYGHLSTAMIRSPSIYPNPVEFPNTELYNDFTSYSSSTSQTSHEAVQSADSFLLPDHIFYGHLSTAMIRYPDASTPDAAAGSYLDEPSVSALQLELSTDTGSFVTST